MSYIITLRDGTAHKLDDIDGASLRDQWESAKRPFPVRIGEDSVLSSQIVSIAKEHLTQADWLTSDVIAESKRIEAKDHCRGEYSIQLEVNRIAHDEGGKDWKKLITDKAWREQARLRLREMNSQWCDYKANECVCEAEYLSDQPRHNPDLVSQREV